MKRIILILILLCISVYTIFSQEIDLSGVTFQEYPGGSIIFNDKYSLTITSNELESNDYEYELDFENKIPFMTVDENEKWLLLFQYNKTYKYGGLFLYNKESKKPNWFWGKESFNFGTGAEYEFISTTELSENGIVYSATNLSNLELDTPWVEGEEGYGIGEIITILSKRPGLGRRYLSKLLFSNGFVSYQKPYLYEANSRVKKIRIKDYYNKFEVVVNLQDTPNLQFISLPILTTGIEIEILEVYKGLKWEDTCINFIIPVDEFE